MTTVDITAGVDCRDTRVEPMYRVVPGQQYPQPVTRTFEGEALVAVTCSTCGWLGWAEPESL